MPIVIGRWKWLAIWIVAGQTGDMIATLRTACPLDCPDTCTLAVTVDDGRIVKVDADDGPGANPFTQGYICQKVKHHAKRVYGPDRVLTPLLRVGTKGSGEFRQASWDEALTLVAERIRAAQATGGIDSVVPYLYSSSSGISEATGLTNLLFAQLGCPDVEHTICASTVGAAWSQMINGLPGADPFDVDHSDLVVVWGANPSASNTHLLPVLTAARQRGAALVVIDPRRTGVAQRADMHLALRPGTDVVLALAAIRRLVELDAHDAAFITQHTVGFEDLLAAAQPWTIERAAAVCGLEEAEIDAFCQLVGQRSPAMLRLGWGLERNRNGGSSVLAVLGLWATAGHFGQRGSGVLGSVSGSAPIDRQVFAADGVSRSTLSMNEVSLALHGTHPAMPKTAVLFVQGANPVATAMDQRAWISGLEGEDVFTVVHEQVMTDTAMLADVVLPATTHFEVVDLAGSYGTFTLQRVEAVIQPVGESRSNNECARGLAAALGCEDERFGCDDLELRRRLTGDVELADEAAFEQRSRVQMLDTFPTFSDGSQRIRLSDAASPLPVPHFIPADDDGLALLTPATNRSINSMFAEFDPPDIAVALHPDDAARRGIANEDLVNVSNATGSIVLLAHIDGSVREGVVSIPKGLWRRHFDGSLTANSLIPLTINDLGAGACFNDARVEITGATRKTRDEVRPKGVS